MLFQKADVTFKFSVFYES